ncbi:hypothetical protein GCM10007049_39470 [Echinicola pacifica]|uniref:Uncharacterized protein n=1 Tax=Echinicola pacifica TaxID=346377 RepID=A0A918QDH0_9BACT|nr:hypothetical protein GCM10007049_39470 [Echinicola pacifica]
MGTEVFFDRRVSPDLDASGMDCHFFALMVYKNHGSGIDHFYFAAHQGVGDAVIVFVGRQIDVVVFGNCKQ